MAMYNRRSLDDKEARHSRHNSRQYPHHLQMRNATGASTLRVFTAASIVLFSLILLFQFDRVFPNSATAATKLSSEINTGLDWGQEFQASNPQLVGSNPEPKLNADGTMSLRRGVVISSYKGQNVDWIDELQTVSPGWEVYRYVPDASPSNDASDDLSELSVANPNGREALSYLTFITDYYATLPDIIVFNHGHARSWHQLEPMVDKMMALNITAVQNEDYVNFRCQQAHGCRPDDMFNVKNPNPKDQRGGNFIKLIWEELMEKEVGPIADMIGRPCCAQFAVSKKAILSHPLSFWQSLRTPLESRKPGDPGWKGRSDYEVGLKFEMFWHVLFGKPPVHCPSKETCENVYFQGAIHCNNDGEEIKGGIDFEERKDDLICVNTMRVD